MRMWSSEGHSRLDGEGRPPAPARGQHHQTGGGRLDLRNLWLVLRWRVRPVALSTLATVALTICAVMILPPKYKAITIVLVDPRQPHVTKSEAVLSGIGADVAAARRPRPRSP